MTLGIPDSLSKLYKKFKTPRTVERRFFKAYAVYLRFYIKFWTWLKYDRKNAAPLYPLKLIWINPNEIDTLVRRSKINKKGMLLPKILDGDWDKNYTKDLNEQLRFKSMKKRFEENEEWEDTEFYQKKLEEIQRTGSTNYGGKINSKQGLDQIFKNIDHLYKSIKQNGYKTQRQIKNKEKIVNAKLRPDHFANELNEIIVDIGRNGELYFHENRHRFYIARILDLDEIPVRVLLRHEDWQEKRNQAVKDSEKLIKKQKQHPDIKYL